MKKFTLYIIAALVIFGIAYTIGYYVGKDLVEQRQLAQVIKAQQPASANNQDQQETVESLKHSLNQEKERSTQLQQALKRQSQKLEKLQNTESLPPESATEPASEIIPSTAYERTAFVTNLIHQFNADNASTEIIDLDCEHDFCFLTADVSAGAKTNPEIANLMSFLDNKKLSRHYQRVDLLQVKKSEDETAEVKISLNMK